MTKNTKDKDQKILTIIVILVLVLVVIQTVNNIAKTIQNEDNRKIAERNDVTRLSVPKGIGAAGFGGDIGTANMCLNSAPIITNDCNLTDAELNTSIDYNCTFEAIDANGDEIHFSTISFTTPPLLNISSNGTVNFTIRRAHLTQTSRFRVYAIDDSQCDNNDTYKEFNVTVVGENRAPYLIRNFSNGQLVKNFYIQLYMNDYFTDPDEDVLGYFPVIETGGTVSVRFLGDIAQIRGVNCGPSTLYLTAIDPSGLTATSNTIQYDVTCPNQSIQPSGQSSSSGSGGGGGGGDSSVCHPDWRCTYWSPCRPDNRSFRRCVDFNACDRLNYMQYFTKNCTYYADEKCIEKWECNEWSICEDGIHTRMCIDKRNCGTTNNKPLEIENCSRIPSCFNGIQDQGETGVDCGGPCGACRNTEEPAKTKRINTVAILVTLLTLGTIGAIMYVFREKLLAIYNKLFGKKPRLKRKVFINNKQKEKLLQLLNIMQVRLDEGKMNHAIDESSILIKEYFKQLLSIDNLDKSELLTKIMKLKDKELEKLLVMFYAKVSGTIHLRNRGAELKAEEVQELIDEISHNIYLIAEFTEQDAINSVKDRATANKGHVELIFNKLSNIYIALKFGELIAAKNVYKEIIKLYEGLSAKEKSIPYTDIIRAFHAIHYLEMQYKES
ncbi:MAG: hypothetical protein ACP5NW_00230 [Candidatus Woesearchaeota archaeon]